MLALIDHHLPVHQDIVDPLGRKSWLLVGGPVLNARQVENHHVGPHALFDGSTIRQPHSRRRPGSHFANGVLQRDYVLVPDVICDKPREITVSAWTSL